ncbi:MAG: pilus assembly protein PilM [Oscillospiraceae bacterium]|nr:pilus assembly protein PilM [Oscillospiraceae bacterium]
MVSIDITDRQIKLARGSLAGSKIKINDAGVRDISEGNIVNGYVTNIPIVAGEVSELLKSMKISDKEVVVCINSSSILYKELEVLKPKTLKNTTAIEAMIIAEMGIGNDYNVSYSIVGEGKNGEGKATIKVMATACPQRLVDSYQTLFTQLGLKLKQINISNNCITRLILNTPKLKDAMPFLCIQVDNDFVNINLYENGQVSLSRYIKIDPSDYENNPDYVNIAVFDNLFRMIQFIGQRPNSQPLRQIMFYGAIKDFVALSNSIASFNIPALVLSMPDNIVKYCDLDFALYANAVGAFYKVDPLLEQINLLQSKAVVSKQSANMFPLQILGALGVSAAAVFAAVMIVNGINNSYIQNREAVQAQIQQRDFDTRRAEMALAEAVLDNFGTYRSSVEIAQILFDFLPRGSIPQIAQNLVAANEYVNANDDMASTFFAFHDVSWSFYNITLTVITGDEDGPADFVEALHRQGFFENIVYAGFETSTRDGLDIEPQLLAALDIPTGANELFVFDLSLGIKGGHIFVEEGGVEREDGLRVFAMD